jgi:hypothetical protein
MNEIRGVVHGAAASILQTWIARDWPTTVMTSPPLCMRQRGKKKVHKQEYVHPQGRTKGKKRNAAEAGDGSKALLNI